MAGHALILSLLGLDGTPEAGGLLASYVRSTTTPRPLCLDVGLSTPATNPVIADSLGTLSVYFDTTLEYSIQAKTANNATVLFEADIVGGAITLTFVNPFYTVNPIVEASWIPALQSPLGGGWPRIFGVSQEQAFGYVNLVANNAAADGSTDDRAALAAAQTAAGANGTVLFPDGDYRLASNITQTCFWAFTPGARILPDNGVTVTVDFAKTLADWSQIYGGLGTIVPAVARGEAKIAWWGVTGANTADEYANANKAVVATRGGVRLDWGGHLGRITRIDTALAVSGAYQPYWANVDINALNVPVGGSVSPKVLISGPALGTSILLTANAAAFATQIQVATALTVGGLYVLQSNQTANGDGVTKRAEMIRIRSLSSGTTYNLEEPLKSAYTTAGAAQVQFFDATATFKHEGDFRLRGDPAKTSDNDYGLRLARLNQAHLPVFIGSDIASAHVAIDLCHDSDVCSDYGDFYDARSTGQGYGLEVGGGFNIRHGDLYGRNLRHVRTFTHSSGTSTAALGNLLGRGLIGGNIYGEEMRDSADDSHAGFINTVTGDCITNFSAGATGSEAFVIEHSKAKYGNIIVNGAYRTIFLIQPFGHPDPDQNYIEIGSISGSVQGIVNDFAGYVLNKSGQNSHPGQSLALSINALHIYSVRSGVKMLAEFGDITFDIGNYTGSVSAGPALLLQSSAADGINGSISNATLDDNGTGAVALIQLDGSALKPLGVQCSILSGRISKTGTGAMYSTSDARLTIGAGVRETIAATSSLDSVTGLGGVSRQRERLAANRTYYVRAAGSDYSPGLLNTDAGAFQTIEKALAVVAALDTNGFDVTVQLSAATRTTTATLPSITGGGRLILLGDETTPANVILSTTNADAIVADSVTGRYSIRGIKLQTTTSGSGIVATGPGVDLTYQNCDFGACASNHIDADFGAKVVASGNYNITAAASRHISAQRDARVNISGRTLTITGTPAFGSAFASATRLGYIQATGCTFSGSATGVRYSVTLNAVIDTGGATLPGGTAGSAATGGQYA